MSEQRSHQSTPTHYHIQTQHFDLDAVPEGLLTPKNNISVDCSWRRKKGGLTLQGLAMTGFTS